MTFVGSISAGRFFGGGGSLAARLRKASMAPLKEGCCETGPVSGRATPPKRSTQWAQPSEQGLRLDSSPGEEGTRCSIHPGQAHSKPQQQPVPANNTTDLIEGMEVGDVKRGASCGGTVRSGSKSRGGRSGPLTGPVYSLGFATPGAFFGPQQLFRTVRDSELGRAPSGEAREMGSETVEVAT